MIMTIKTEEDWEEWWATSKERAKKVSLWVIKSFRPSLKLLYVFRIVYKQLTLLLKLYKSFLKMTVEKYSGFGNLTLELITLLLLGKRLILIMQTWDLIFLRTLRSQSASSYKGSPSCWWTDLGKWLPVHGGYADETVRHVFTRKTRPLNMLPCTSRVPKSQAADPYRSMTC